MMRKRLPTEIQVKLYQWFEKNEPHSIAKFALKSGLSYATVSRFARRIYKSKPNTTTYNAIMSVIDDSNK
jgi:hypothetical protein